MTCPICGYLIGLRDAAASGSYESNRTAALLAEHEERYHPERCEHGLTRSECNSNHVPEFVKSQPD
jgi:hypothetical protein